MKTLSIPEVAAFLLQGDRYVILTHRRPDGDTIGCAAALCGGLRSIGWNVPDAQGTMFVWAKIPERFASSVDFAIELMEKTGVIVVPGSAFGAQGEGYVRMALVVPPERMAEAVRRIDESGIVKE